MIKLTPYLNVLKIKWKGNRYPSPLFGHLKNFSWGSRGEGNDHIIWPLLSSFSSFKEIDIN